MKTKLTLFAILIAALSISAFAQVKVTSDIVKYERKGADIPDFKKSFEINYPRFSGLESKDTLKRLEKTFSYWNVFDTTLEDETDNHWLEFFGYQVLYNKNDILVMELYVSGSGAYPDQSTRTIAADTNSGNQIRIKDVFKNRIGLLTELDKRQQAEMAAELKRFAEEQLDDTDGVFENVPMASDEVEEFSVNDSGVTFIFDYGFAHAIQALQPEGKYFFSWDQLKPFLREYSPVDMIAKKAEAPGVTTVIVDLRLNAILGGVKNGDFVDGLAAANHLEDGIPFVVINPGHSVLGGLTIENTDSKYTGKLDDEQPQDLCPEYRAATITPKVESGLAFSKNAKWNPVPQKITILDPQNAVYEKAVTDFLKTRNLPASKPKITNIYKVDLEGDGTDEVVISATNYTHKDYIVQKGGYSFVMVRKVINGKAVDILLGGDFITGEDASAESTYEISGIADLNGDGKMEIVVYSAYYEGASTAAYKIENGVAKMVMETGCGV